MTSLEGRAEGSAATMTEDLQVRGITTGPLGK